MQRIRLRKWFYKDRLQIIAFILVIHIVVCFYF